jgi:hypothetical protein
MKYELARDVLGSSASIELSEAEYLQLKSAQKNLLEALFMEEKLDVVISNYLELETDLLSSAARHMVQRNQDYIWFQTERNLLNRRLVNLLTACRSYMDQTRHHLSNIFGNESDIVTKIEEYKAKQYDQYLGYRVMEALRNYVQHRGFPIHGITYNSQWLESKSEDERKLLFSLTPYMSPRDLEEDGKFKKSVLEEVKRLGDTLDIKPLIREYVGALSTVHERIREALREDIQIWEQTVLGALDRFLKEYPEEKSVIGLIAVAESEDGVGDQPIHLFRDFIEYRKQFERKNSALENLAKRYVTSEIIKPKA